MRICFTVDDCPGRHLLFVGYNRVKSKLWYPIMGVTYALADALKVLVLHYMLLWPWLSPISVQCLIEVPTCMNSVIYLEHKYIELWDSHQGMDLGVQRHIYLVINE